MSAGNMNPKVLAQHEPITTEWAHVIPYVKRRGRRRGGMPLLAPIVQVGEEKIRSLWPLKSPTPPSPYPPKGPYGR